MSRALTAPAPSQARPMWRGRIVGVGLTAVLAACSASVPSDQDPVAPVKTNRTAPAAPLLFGDPVIAKGAHGDEPDDSTVRVFNDPTVRKGAGGR